MKELPNKHTAVKLASHPGLADCDMELIVGNPADPLCYNKTFRAVMTIEGQPEVDFYIFDLVMEGVPFCQRYRELTARFAAGLMPPNAKLVTQSHVGTQNFLDELYAEVTAEGHEGLILKSPEGLYKYGRATAKSQDLLKLKPEDDFEFEILSCYEAMENQNEEFTNELGRTDRSSHQENLVGKGMLGGFVARAITNGDDKAFAVGVEFNCAPGKLTHEERTALWQGWLADPDAVRSRIGKCRHFPIGLVEKPRHPRWIGWRVKEDMT